MLTNAPVTLTLLVVDVDRARKFYEAKLGFKPLRATSSAVLYDCGGGMRIWLYQQEATKGDHTVAVFRVEDIETEVRELKEKGVVFEEYDTPSIKTVNSIATLGPQKGAWFKDTEGHIFALTQL